MVTAEYGVVYRKIEYLLSRAAAARLAGDAEAEQLWNRAASAVMQKDAQ